MYSSPSRYVNKKCVPRPTPKPWPRKVYEVYSGHDLEFDGAIVVELIGGVERILYWAQSKGAVQGYDDDAEREADRPHMLGIAQAVAADQANYRKLRRYLIDYRRYGLDNSKERMPEDPYRWHLYEPGRFHKDVGRQIFPYCPWRAAEMLRAGETIRKAINGSKGVRRGHQRHTDANAITSTKRGGAR